MVLIHMKATNDKDEWFVQVPAATPTQELIAELCFLHNARIRLRSQSMALWNLLFEEGHGHMAALTQEQKDQVKALWDKTGHATHRDRIGERFLTTRERFVALVEECEALAKAVFQECQVADPVAALWKKRDDSDISEDDRLRAWYYLELIDPMFKERDYMKPDEAKLWFCGKEIETGKLLSDYSGRNDKSKIVCKLQTTAKGCPAREPKMELGMQREMRQHFVAKRDAFKQLETSELADHAAVRPKAGDFVAYRAPGSTGTQFFGDGARGAVDESAKAGGEGLLKLNTDVRRIHHSGKTETLLP
eukprot:TRINITY_DN29995_c0_g1_i1.p1 TRINITY_DN29995_c0_g1~~TRINITY_DN29995_c0_g1_i1.p1  ORF type:complete len:305 (+),score=148.54 TRINITY_DN29995_c0_g1_i1:76-990(+)